MPTPPPLGTSSSSISLVAPKYPPQGTMRIADQVIEEVDEQLTIHSTRGSDKRPTAQSLFASSHEKIPMRSVPIDVPGSHHNSNGSYEQILSAMNPEHQPYLFPSNNIFSSSAPEENMIHATSNEQHKGTPGSVSKEGMIFKSLLWTFFCTAFYGI